jgi:hypothetical protein
MHVLHLLPHLFHHLTKKSHTPPAGCRKCQKNSGTMYTTHCCKAQLCESCVRDYERVCVRVCAYCGGNVIRK